MSSFYSDNFKIFKYALEQLAQIAITEMSLLYKLISFQLNLEIVLFLLKMEKQNLQQQIQKFMPQS